MARKLFQAMVVFFVLLAQFVAVSPVSAAQLIQCDANGKCTANVGYYSDAYTGNIEYGFKKLGQGTNSWTIQGGNVPVSFGKQIGSMSDKGYVELYNVNGDLLNAVGVCDVSAILHWYAVTQLGMRVENPGNHAQVPILPNDPEFRDTIYQDDNGVYTQDTIFYNSGSDVTIYWSIDSSHNLTIWNSKGGGPALQVPNLPVIVPEIVIPETVNIVDETGSLASRCPEMITNVVETTYPEGITVHHTVTDPVDWFTGSIGTLHCNEKRPPYLLVIDPEGVIHRTAVYGSKTYHALDPNNVKYASIAVVGDFEFRQQELPEVQRKALVQAIRWLIEQGATPKVYGHRDVLSGTSCPGDVLYALLPEIAKEANAPVAVTGTAQQSVTLPFDFSNVRWDLLVGLLAIVVAIYYFLFAGKREEVVVAAIIPEEDPKAGKAAKFFKLVADSSLIGAWLTATLWLLVNHKLLMQASQVLLGTSYGLDVLFGSMVVFWMILWRTSERRSGYYVVRQHDGSLKLFRGAKKIKWAPLLLAIALLSLGFYWYFGLRGSVVGLTNEAFQIQMMGDDLESVMHLLKLWGWDGDTGWVERLTQAPDQLVQLTKAVDLIAAILMVVAVGLIVSTLLGGKVAFGTLLVGLILVLIGNFGIKVDWNVLAQEVGLVQPTTSSSKTSLLPQGDGTLYSGVYGALSGWGTLGTTSTPEGAIELAEAYAEKTRGWYKAGNVVPVVNIRFNKSERDIDAVIAGCIGKCIVLVDITPNQDVSYLIGRWAGAGEHVWFDIDLEHRGVKTSASEFNIWAKQYADIRKQSGYTSLGVFAFYDFRGEPWLTPPSEVTYSYNEGKVLVIPIFDGHCSGTPCAQTKFDATRRTLDFYPGAKAVGIMEFLSRWGCGSVYGDCGFTDEQYYNEFKPLLYIAQ
jgi:hypothetical protein